MLRNAQGQNIYWVAEPVSNSLGLDPDSTHQMKKKVGTDPSFLFCFITFK